MGEDSPRRDLDRLTVAEAAEALEVSQDAVRKRIARGTIPHDRDHAGRVFVYLDVSKTVHKTVQDTGGQDTSGTAQDARIQDLQDQIRFLRAELERKDAIMLSMAQRIPELEPAESRQESAQEPPQDAGEGAGGVEERAGRKEAQRGTEDRGRSWIERARRRIFG